MAREGVRSARQSINASMDRAIGRSIAGAETLAARHFHPHSACGAELPDSNAGRRAYDAYMHEYESGATPAEAQGGSHCIREADSSARRAVRTIHPARLRGDGSRSAEAPLALSLNQPHTHTHSTTHVFLGYGE